MNRCAITGYPVKPEKVKPTVGPVVEYESPFIGNVKVAISIYDEFLNGDFERYLIAGICKERALKNLEPVLIDGEFIRSGYKNYNPPTEFEEKCFHLLKTLYGMGGRQNKSFDLNSTQDFALAYADQEEFVRIVEQLESDYDIDISKTHRLASGGQKVFMGVRLTGSGKEKAQKAFPKMPMVGLVSQEITTRDPEIDLKINNARDLFFSEPRTMDKMRSACETLSHVLEPLRDDLKNYFTTKDVSDFFHIVNAFDVRHNKESTKNLVEEEQLEWVFYTLLNTINCYTKLKNKWRSLL